MRHVEELPDEEVWETSGGIKVPLKAMSTTHLRNALRYMKRVLREADTSGWEDAPNGADQQLGFEIESMEEKVGKLEGETVRRLNNKGQGSESLPITASMRQAEEDYRTLMGG